MFANLYTGTQLELLYVLTFGLIMLFSILAYTRKMSVGIAMISLITGLGVAWLIAPYSSIVISPIANYVIYGYAPTWHTWIAFGHVITTVLMVVIAGYNLLRSGGKIIWA